MKHRVITSSAAAALVLATAACGGGGSTSSSGGGGGSLPNATVTKIEYVALPSTPGAADTLFVAFHEANPSDKTANQRITMTAYDAAGKVLTTDKDDQFVLAPKAETAYGTPVVLDKGVKAADVAKVDVSVQLFPSDTHLEAGKTITAGTVVIRPGDMHDWRADTTLTSTYTKTFTNAQVSTICYDAAGKLVGGDHGQADSIPAGKSFAFLSAPILTAGAPAKCEVYGHANAS